MTETPDLIERVRHWRVAQINEEPRPFAIIRSDGPHGDEFVATRITAEDAAALSAMIDAALRLTAAPAR